MFGHPRRLSKSISALKFDRFKSFNSLLACNLSHIFSLKFYFYTKRILYVYNLDLRLLRPTS